MNKSEEKRLLLNLDEQTYNKFFISYVGARTLKKGITKVSFFSSILLSGFREDNLILQDNNFDMHTLNDLYHIGLAIVDGFKCGLINEEYINKILSKNDSEVFTNISNTNLHPCNVSIDLMDAVQNEVLDIKEL